MRLSQKYLVNYAEVEEGKIVREVVTAIFIKRMQKAMKTKNT